MKLATIKNTVSLPEYKDAFTEPSLRWHIHNSANNRMNEMGVIVRLRGRVYIDLDLFPKWLETFRTAA